MTVRGGNRVYFLVDGYGPCGWYRCSVPATALVAAGYEASIGHELNQKIIEWADVLVIQRHAEPAVLQAIEFAERLGKLTVFELDDDFWSIPQSNPCYFRYSHPTVIKGVEQASRSAQLVTTTTQSLATRLRKYNPRVKVLPNMLPAPLWPHESPKQQRDDKVVIGWAGSNTHFADLSLLRGVIEQVLDEFPSAEFHWAGMREVPFAAHPRIKELEPVTIDRYSELVSQFDIGLAPLEDTAFNQSKSDLKYLEYAVVGMPVIASRVAPYEKVIEQGQTGFTARNAKDWLRYLKMLVSDTTLRQQIGANAQAYARSRLIESNTDLWVRAYGLGQPLDSGVATTPA